MPAYQSSDSVPREDLISTLLSGACCDDGATCEVDGACCAEVDMDSLCCGEDACCCGDTPIATPKPEASKEKEAGRRYDFNA